MKSFETTGLVTADGKLTIDLRDKLKAGTHRVRLFIDEETVSEAQKNRILGLFETDCETLDLLTDETMKARESASLRN